MALRVLDKCLYVLFFHKERPPFRKRWAQSFDPGFQYSASLGWSQLIQLRPYRSYAKTFSGRHQVYGKLKVHTLFFNFLKPAPRWEERRVGKECRSRWS